MFSFVLIAEQVTELDSFHRKVDNGWVFLHEESVLCESFDEQDNKLGQANQFELFQKIILISFIFLLRLTVELGENVVQRDLRDDVLVKLVLKEWGRGKL